MSDTYTMEDGRIVKTENAVASWNEDTDWDGSNHISKATGSQWEHERLYKSKKGNYYLEWWSQWQGTTPGARWLTPQEAAHWLIAQNESLPADLAEFEDELTE